MGRSFRRQREPGRVGRARSASWTWRTCPRSTANRRPRPGLRPERTSRSIVGRWRPTTLRFWSTCGGCGGLAATSSSAPGKVSARPWSGRAQAPRSGRSTCRKESPAATANRSYASIRCGRQHRLALSSGGSRAARASTSVRQPRLRDRRLRRRFLRHGPDRRRTHAGSRRERYRQGAAACCVPGGLCVWHDFCPDASGAVAQSGAARRRAGDRREHRRWRPLFDRLYWIRKSWILVGERKPT